ncbi:glycosyltransferase [Flavobacterium agricola]|uniref:Glycosyltransferase n=1 Tax=Flavobacterium agricola TaxID=2870839 RepID=A0ABY6M2I4_9FLAO|nr:glycosyltransferase [Flavobacterium agricola]UYW01854.1 glycosyltransferase [Flavobacterium agricola]
MFFSIIIPIYNRPDEIDELLQTLTQQTYNQPFEIVVVEDGSSITCEHIIAKYQDKLNVSYFFKPNSGPGDSRNFGMQKAQGDYFIIFDSDCLIPEQYLAEVDAYLSQNFVHCFGGPDAAHNSFSDIQKAINHTMTSFLTTGGVRGGSEKIDKFQPRSFNMGISRQAFVATQGFGKVHPGEDPDLSIRLWNLGYDTALISNAYVYHKRRIDFKKFYKQVNKFGKARPILNFWYPKYKKLTYWFPVCYVFQFLLSLILTLLGVKLFLYINIFYLFLIAFQATISYKSLKIGFLTVLTTLIQFTGYALGFIKAYFKIFILKIEPKKALPDMFFK